MCLADVALRLLLLLRQSQNVVATPLENMMSFDTFVLDTLTECVWVTAR